MSKKLLRRFLIVGVAGFLVAGSGSIALGKKPPWAQDDKNDPPPVSAPEPTVFSLIGVGFAGVAGYYLVNKKRKK